MIAAGIIGIIIAYFIISVIRQQKKYLQVQRSKIAAEINTLEKERARVASDLHDELGPTLSAVKFKLSSIEDLAVRDEKIMLHAMDQIDNILTQVRQISNGLMPGTLSAKGPVYAIERFIESKGSIPGLTITVVQKKDNIAFAASQSIHVYRILQEIIHNTIRHAQAKRLSIQLDERKNWITIAAADDGKGFNRSVATKMGHLGLRNLQSRVDILNGIIQIDTAIGRGTRIYIEIPHPQQTDQA